MNDLLQIDRLTISLPSGGDRMHAVKDVSFSVKTGEIVCVVGESGSGKSTLAHAILGLLPRGLNVTQGAIWLDGTDLTSLRSLALEKLRGKRISMVFQEPMSALNPLMKCGKQILEVMQAHGRLDVQANTAVIDKLMDDVGLPDAARILNSYPFQLSGGQRQRIMIAMALALEPEFLIADEPTTALDVTTQAQILKVLLAIQKRTGLGILFITHDFGVVAEIAHRILVMKDGELVELGDANAVLRAPQMAYTKRLLAAVPSAHPPAVTPGVEDVAPRSAGDQTILQVVGLKKTYRGKRTFWGSASSFPAVSDVSFHINRGETVGLVGESGSGKSTIGRILAGLVTGDEGVAQWNGINLLKPGVFSDIKVRRAVQMIFQDPYGSLNPRHKVSTILTSGLMAQGMAKREALERALELLKLVQLDPGSIDRFPHEFSGGQRQRLGFARAIATSPELIIADEPVSALDVSVQEQVLTLLREHKQRLKLSMLFITHDLRVAAQLCDRVIVLQKGKIVEQGTAAAVLQSPEHPYTQQLVHAVPGRNWR